MGGDGRTLSESGYGELLGGLGVEVKSVGWTEVGVGMLLERGGGDKVRVNGTTTVTGKSYGKTILM